MATAQAAAMGRSTGRWRKGTALNLLFAKGVRPRRDCSRRRHGKVRRRSFGDPATAINGNGLARPRGRPETGRSSLHRGETAQDRATGGSRDVFARPLIREGHRGRHWMRNTPRGSRIRSAPVTEPAHPAQPAGADAGPPTEGLRDTPWPCRSTTRGLAAMRAPFRQGVAGHENPAACRICASIPHVASG